MDIFRFKIVWRKAIPWRGFYATHNKHKLKVRWFKKSGWHLFVDGRQKGGSPHPLGFAILLRFAEETFINGRSVSDALRIAEESLTNGQSGTHGPAPGASAPGIGAGEGGIAHLDGGAGGIGGGDVDGDQADRSGEPCGDRCVLGEEDSQ